jgi:hypothetical protein
VAGSRIQASVDANIIVNKDSGKPEGTFGSFQYGEPLYSTRQEWAWGGVASWRKEIARRFVGTTLATFDADVTPEPDAIPYVYDAESISGQVAATRSFGVDVKHDLTLGMAVSRRAYRVPALPEVDPRAVQEFEESAVPVSDTSNGPFMVLHFYLNQYRELLDVETLGLQESFLTGPEIYLRLQPVAQLFASTRNYVSHSLALAHTQAFGTGFVRPYVAGAIDVAPSDGTIYDTRAQVGLRVVSPSFYIGRLVYDATALWRPHNFLNVLSDIGGDGRLRGYPSALYLGDNVVASNLEFRSRPFTLWTFQIGGVLFYDMADAYDELAEFRPKHGGGFGVRVVAPQLQRSVIRVDWGFTMTHDRCLRGNGRLVPTCTPPTPFDGLVITFEQAFGVPRPGSSGVSTLPP